MAFVVEDGTGLPNANSYASVAEADTYFSDRGNEDWANATSNEKESALVLATDYIDIRFNFVGQRLTTTQSLEWPRKGIGVPSNIVRATLEYASRALTGNLAPDPITGQRLVTKEKVGPIERTFGIVSSQYLAFNPYPLADALLKDYTYTNRQVIR